MKFVQIKDSYNIWRPKEMRGKILEACHNKYGSDRHILHHENSAAKLLNRTYLSMIVEWYLHNIAYYLTKPLRFIPVCYTWNRRAKDVDIEERVKK